MYEELFQTTERPFRATPDVRFYFPFDSIEQTRQTVLRAVRRAEGPAAVMGGIGLGKSLLASLLTEDLADRFDVVRLHAARLCSRRAMLQSILFELQLPYRDLSEGELRLSLMERMEPSPAHAAEGLALIVDEAQTLPTKLLEELRLITNFARAGQSRARLVLLGSLQLEETLAMPEMSSFNQRLAARCFLQPMNRVQTADFVRHQFTCAGVDPKQIITRDALENAYIASEGIPRLVNQVMDHALILAIASEQYPISASLVQEAWSDLQQLPMAWNQPEAVQDIPVEFGSIDDLDQDFELEPEGMDEMESATVSSLDWPAPSDLEDFGPAAQTIAMPIPNRDSQSQVSQSQVSPANKPQFVAQTSRVVFDASTLFANRSTGTTPSVDPTSTSSTPSGRLQPMSVSQALTSDQDMFIFPEEQEDTAEDATAVRNKFAAWNPTPGTYTYEIEIPISQFGGALSSIMDQQPDDNQVNEFEESDYQLAAWPDDVNPLAVPMPIADQTSLTDTDPFGQDFDEEFEVEATDVQRWQARQRERAGLQQTPAPSPAQSQPTKMAAAEDTTESVEDYQAMALNTYADALQIDSVVVHPDYSPVTPFIAMTATGAVDERLYAEIEDMISQLNFSAFSVEMDTVEQISPECIRQAAAAQFNNDDSYADDHQVLQMPREESIRTSEANMDDDRDLLIIEEEVPASMRHQSPAPVAAPTPHTLSYPDLFQQLRG